MGSSRDGCVGGVSNWELELALLWSAAVELHLVSGKGRRMRHRRAMDTREEAGYKKGIRVLPRPSDGQGGATGGMRHDASSSQRLRPAAWKEMGREV